MTKHVVPIVLNKEQEAFVKWLVRRDRVYDKAHHMNVGNEINAESELACMLMNKLNEYMDYFEREGEYNG